MKNYQIFISYRRDGGEMLGQLLHDRLTQEGYTVFFDVESLRSGKFNDELYRVMEECTDIIVVLPPNALYRCEDAEDWVRKEISFCIEKKKNIIPIMMRGFEFPENLPDDIVELRNYNGISAMEVSSFPWVLEKLTTKFLISKPKINNKGNSAKTRENSILDIITSRVQQILAAFMLVLPFIVQWFALDLSWLPDSIEKFLSYYTNIDLGLLTLILIAEIYLIYRFVIKGDFEYVQKKYKEKNIHEDFLDCTFDEFIRKLLLIDNVASIIKNSESCSEKMDEYAEYKCFKGIEIGSIEGRTVEYLYVDFLELPCADDISFLYLDKQTGKQRAIKFLSRQGYIFCEEKDDILQFKKNKTTIRLAYTEAGMSMIAMEMTKKDDVSKIREKTYDTWNNSFVRETRLGLKTLTKGMKKLFKDMENEFFSFEKKKQNLILMWLAVFFALLIVGIILLSIR